jgi:hypothetical protein
LGLFMSHECVFITFLCHPLALWNSNDHICLVDIAFILLLGWQSFPWLMILCRLMWDYICSVRSCWCYGRTMPCFPNFISNHSHPNIHRSRSFIFHNKIVTCFPNFISNHSHPNIHRSRSFIVHNKIYI